MEVSCPNICELITNEGTGIMCSKFGVECREAIGEWCPRINGYTPMERAEFRAAVEKMLD